MYALMIHALQGANWQRGGGTGDRPTFMERPREASEIDQADETESFDLSNIREELARRRARSTPD